MKSNRIAAIYDESDDNFRRVRGTAVYKKSTEADRARFAPGTVDAPEVILERASDLIDETERTWNA